MSLLSLFAAAASAVLAQTAPAPSLAVYEHSAKKATLVVITPAGAARPAAVYLQGEKGRWLVMDADLYRVGRDDGWAQIRYDIYFLDKQGLSYTPDSYASPSVRLWTDADAVPAVEAVAAKLAYDQGLKEAPLDCLTRVSEAGKAVNAAASARSGYETAEKLSPGHILYPERLPELKTRLDAARDAQARAKAACEKASAAAFSGASAEAVAPLFFDAVNQADAALAAGEGAQRELDGMRVPNY